MLPPYSLRLQGDNIFNVFIVLSASYRHLPQRVSRVQYYFICFQYFLSVISEYYKKIQIQQTYYLSKQISTKHFSKSVAVGVTIHVKGYTSTAVDIHRLEGATIKVSCFHYVVAFVAIKFILSKVHAKHKFSTFFCAKFHMGMR